MSIRESYGGKSGRAVVTREAICDRCGWTTGRVSARSLSFANAGLRLSAHQGRDCEGMQDTALRMIASGESPALQDREFRRIVATRILKMEAILASLTTKER
jgi:hypothetical protein